MRESFGAQVTGERTCIENEGRTLQIESKRDSVRTDGDTFSDAVMVIDFVTIILQLGGGGEELTEVNARVGATVVNARVNQSLEMDIRIFAEGMIGVRVPDGPPRGSNGGMDQGIVLPSG